MIDNIIHIANYVFFITAALLIYRKFNLIGFLLLFLVFFMTGINTFSANDLPWEYLILNGSLGDWSEAIFDGLFFVAVVASLLSPVWFYVKKNEKRTPKE